nr:hypothetical protein [Propionibacterium sp.]
MNEHAGLSNEAPRWASGRRLLDWFAFWARQISLPSDAAPDSRSRRTLAVVAVLGFAFLLLPRPTGLVAEHLHKEDGMIFLTDYLREGFGGLFAIYSGYLHVGPRLIVGSCAAVLSPEALTGCIAASTAGVRALATMLAFWVFLPYARSWRWALTAAAGAFLFLPNGQQEILGNVTNLRWILVAATATALLGVFKRWPQIILASAFAVLGALSDPLALVLAPLALVRLLTARGRSLLVPVTYGTAALVQFLMMRSGDRAVAGDQSVFANLSDAAIQLLVRGVAVTQYGLTGTEALMMAGGARLAVAATALPIVTVVLALRLNRTNRPLVGFLLLWCTAGLGLLGVTFVFADMKALALTDWWSPASASRYSALVGFFLTPALVLASASLWDKRPLALAPRVLALATLAALVLACAADFRGDSWNTHGPKWADTVYQARVQCQSSRDDQVVPITPQGVPMPWTATLTCEWLRGG